MGQGWTTPGGDAPPRREALALAAVAGAVLTWGFSNVAIKLLSTSGLVASFYRLWFAIPLLWLVPALAPSIRRRMDRAWLSGSLIGGAWFAVHQVLFFTSLKLTTVANVSIIGALQPALVLLVGGRMFGERATAAALLWSAVALIGTVIVIIGAAGAPAWSPLGDAIAFANLFAFTGYFLASKRIRATVGTPEYLTGMTTVAGLVMSAIALATGQDLMSPRGADWAILIGLALLPGTLGHFLTNWAHPHTSAFVISIMLLAVPVLATAGAVVFLAEPLGPAQLAGGTIVLVAIGAIVRSAAAGEELAESAAETDAP